VYERKLARGLQNKLEVQVYRTRGGGVGEKLYMVYRIETEIEREGRERGGGW
jgi:hypothetical protein